MRIKKQIRFRPLKIKPDAGPPLDCHRFYSSGSGSDSHEKNMEGMLTVTEFMMIFYPDPEQNRIQIQTLKNSNEDPKLCIRYINSAVLICAGTYSLLSEITSGSSIASCLSLMAFISFFLGPRGILNSEAEIKKIYML